MGGKRGEFLPCDGDKRLHREPDAAADSSRASSRRWIAPPKLGIDNKPGDFEYVKIANA